MSIWAIILESDDSGFATGIFLVLLVFVSLQLQSLRVKALVNDNSAQSSRVLLYFFFQAKKKKKDSHIFMCTLNLVETLLSEC